MAERFLKAFRHYNIKKDMNLRRKLFGTPNKNNLFLYNTQNIFSYLIPDFFFRKSLTYELSKISLYDYEYIQNRVN